MAPGRGKSAHPADRQRRRQSDLTRDGVWGQLKGAQAWVFVAVASYELADSFMEHGDRMSAHNAAAAALAAVRKAHARLAAVVGG